MEEERLSLTLSLHMESSIQSVWSVEPLAALKKEEKKDCPESIVLNVEFGLVAQRGQYLRRSETFPVSSSSRNVL